MVKVRIKAEVSLGVACCPVWVVSDPPCGTWRPTDCTHWLDRGTEQLLGVCLVSGGFDWGSMRPGEARGESPAEVAFIPVKTVPRTVFRPLSAVKRTKAHQKHRKQGSRFIGPALRALVRVKPGSDPPCPFLAENR